RTEEGRQTLEPRKLTDRLAGSCGPIAGELLCKQACREAGLDDLGEPPLEPALSILATSLQHEANLHLMGRFLMRAHLKGLLATRLRLVQEWRQMDTPSPIRSPLFITGMPRSGSTFLHELLAQDPANRVPHVYEVMFPVKPQVSAKCDPRIRRAAACLWMFRRLAPRADSVHPLRAETPQECVAMHSYTLHSEEFITTCRIPTYEAFLHTTDCKPAYVWQNRFLQHLQLSGPAGRWVLKSPDHAYGLEALFSVFPDARVVQTHRNPVDVLKSSIQLVEVLHRVFARRGNRQESALREARLLADAMERFIKFRETHSELAGRFLDVNYGEMVADPMATVSRIYRHLETPLTQTAIEAMRRLIANRSRYQKKGHAPSLADLGIDVRTEASRFKRYCSCFGIPWHPAEVG